MVNSILPPNTLPNGGFFPFSSAEETLVVNTLKDLGEHRVKRALVMYKNDREKQGSNVRPMLSNISPNLEKRGVSPVAVQLINVTAAQSLEFFWNFVYWVFKPAVQEVSGTASVE